MDVGDVWHVAWRLSSCHKGLQNGLEYFHKNRQTVDDYTSQYAFWVGCHRSWYENNEKREKVKEAIESVENDLSKGRVVSVHEMKSLLIQCRTTRSHYLIGRLHNLVKSGKIDQTMEIFKQLIYAYVERKEVEKAYDMLKDVEKCKMELTSDMLNVIIAGFFNQGSHAQGFFVYDQMMGLRVKCDSTTYEFS